MNSEFLRQQASDDSFGKLIIDLLPYIDMNSLDIRSEEDFGNMLGTLSSLTAEAFTKAFFDISTMRTAAPSMPRAWSCSSEDS